MLNLLTLNTINHKYYWCFYLIQFSWFYLPILNSSFELTYFRFIVTGKYPSSRTPVHGYSGKKMAQLNYLISNLNLNFYKSVYLMNIVIYLLFSLYCSKIATLIFLGKFMFQSIGLLPEFTTSTISMVAYDPTTEYSIETSISLTAETGVFAWTSNFASQSIS